MAYLRLIVYFRIKVRALGVQSNDVIFAYVDGTLAVQTQTEVFLNYTDVHRYRGET